MKGELTNSEFERGDACLVVAGNSISMNSFGIAKNVYLKYVFGDVIAQRERVYNLNRCKIKDRPSPGTINFSKPQNYPHCGNTPSVVTLFNQFSYGKPIEENVIAKKYMEKSKDNHLVLGLSKDSCNERLSNFKQCIQNLKKEALKTENQYTKLYAFPVGIGRGDRVDRFWVDNYLPLLKEFANEMLKEEITTILVIPPEYQDLPVELKELYIRGRY